MRGWVRLVFILSLGLNLLVAGVLIGGWVADDRPGPHPDVLQGPLGAAFSESDRKAMRAEAMAAGANLNEMRASFRADMGRVIDALEADPWNPDTVRDLLHQLRERGLRRSDIGEQVMLSHLGQMTPEDRHAYAERLRARLLQGRDGKP